MPIGYSGKQAATLTRAIRHCGLVESARTWDGTGCELRVLEVSDIYPVFIEPRITRVPSGFSGYIIGLIQKIVFEKKELKLLN